MPKITAHAPRPPRTGTAGPFRSGRTGRPVRRVLRLAPTVAGAALAGAIALTGLASAPVASAAEALPDFADCPALPAGVDPGSWRCEVHSAAPRLTMGNVTVTLAPITMTHAEGPMPDGSQGQVWGAMHTAATPVPGGLTGTAAAGQPPLPGLAIHPEYGGRSDFYTGRFSLRFRLVGPLLPRACVIGSAEPVDFALKRPSPSEWVSTNPPVIKFSAYDDTFAAPAAEHCGPLTRALDRRLGLPAPSGNLMSYDATYTFRTYDRLPTR